MAARKIVSVPNFLNLSLQEVGELSLIRAFEKLFKSQPRSVILGVGDDSSVVSFGGGRLILTTDSMVEGIHFSLRCDEMGSTRTGQGARAILLKSVGHRAVVSCVSDVAAMGGRPLFGVISLGFPGSFRFEEAVILAKTVRDVSVRLGGSIVGGDTVESDNIFISVTFTGVASDKKFVRRGGARPGDIVFVTGRLGDSASGLMLLKKAELPLTFGRKKIVKSGRAAGRRSQSRARADLTGLLPEAGRVEELIGATVARAVLKKHLFPEPRLVEGRIACEMGATSMIDISDGLATELNHIARSSGVQIEVEMGKIPVGKASTKLGAFLKRDPLHQALFGGEEYELVFTALQGRGEAIGEKIRAKTGTEVTAIGKVKKGTPKVILRDGKFAKTLRPSGYEHFARR